MEQQDGGMAAAIIVATEVAVMRVVVVAVAAAAARAAVEMVWRTSNARGGMGGGRGGAVRLKSTETYTKNHPVVFLFFYKRAKVVERALVCSMKTFPPQQDVQNQQMSVKDYAGS